MVGGLRTTAVALMAAAVVLGGCSSTRGVSMQQTETTIRRIDDDRLVDNASANASSAAVQQVNTLVNRLLAADDACAILTQSDLQGYTLDASSLAGSAVRRAVATGVVAVYNRTINLVPQDDATLIASLRVQRETFVEVLDVVERYSANPTSQQAADQIRTLVSSEQFIKATEVVNLWVYQNCSVPG